MNEIKWTSKEDPEEWGDNNAITIHEAADLLNRTIDDNRQLIEMLEQVITQVHEVKEETPELYRQAKALLKEVKK